MELEKLKKKHQEKIERFQKWVKVDRNNLDSELAMNSSRMYSTGLKKSEAEFLMEKAKAVMKQIKARVKMKWSKASVGGKRITIPQLDAKVESDPEVMKAEMDYIDAQYVYRICESAFQSIKEKGQQITNLANNRRAELTYKYVKEGKEDRVNEKAKDQSNQRRRK